MTRLRAGEWIALAGGAGVLVSLFLPWHAARARAATVTGFEALSVTDVLLLLLTLLTIALAVLQATQDSPTKPVGAAVVTVAYGILCTLIVLLRIVNQPGPNEFIDVRAGAWIGLAATMTIVAGAWWAMADEHVRGLPPGPEPELRPTPAA